MSMSKHNRARRRHHQNTSLAPSAGPKARRFASVPPPIFIDTASSIQICDPAPPPPPPDAEPGRTGAGGGSRANAMKHGRRSKILFTEAIFDAIELAYQDFAAKLLPVGPIENFLVLELARSKIQDEKCGEQLVINDLRASQRVGSCWDLDNA